MNGFSKEALREINAVKPVIFSITAKAALAADILASGLFEEGLLARSMDDKGAPQAAEVPFPDGERYLRLLSDVEGRSVVILGSGADAYQALETLDLAHLMAENGALCTRVIIDDEDESVFAKGLMEVLLSSTLMGCPLAQVTRIKLAAKLAVSNPRRAECVLTLAHKAASGTGFKKLSHRLRNLSTQQVVSAMNAYARGRKGKQLVYHTASYGHFAEGMGETGAFVAGSQSAMDLAAQGELAALTAEANGRTVVLVGGTVSDEETAQLLSYAHALARAGAWEVRVVVPFMGYSTMERAIKPGEAVKAKTRALLLSAVLCSVPSNCVFLVDLHAEGIQHYFEYGVHVKHIYAKPVIIDSVKQILVDDYKLRTGKTELSEDELAEALKTPFVFASTDAGRAKWVESLTSDMARLGLNAESAFIIKRRLSGEKTEVRDISAHVEGLLVIIYDDMVRTGGSLIKAGDAYRAKGASDVAGILTHCVMPGKSKEKLKASKAFRVLVVTDSHCRAELLAGDGLVVNSITALLAGAVSKGRAELV